jgi:hypothetical protein
MKIRLRQVLLRTLALLVGGGVLLAMVGFGLFRSDPSWYRRVQLTEEEQAAGQQRLFDRLATLRNEVGRQQAANLAHPAAPATTRPTFDIEITEDELNGVLMRWGAIDPRTRAILAEIDEPHVRFLPGRIEFAGRSKSLGTIVSIEATVTQGDDGLARLQLGRPWAGRLPLTRSIVEAPAAKLLATMRESKHVPKSIVDSLALFVVGEEVTPVVPLVSSLQGEGLLPARVEKLTVGEGTLKATLRTVE